MYLIGFLCMPTIYIMHSNIVTAGLDYYSRMYEMMETSRLNAWLQISQRTWLSYSCCLILSQKRRKNKRCTLKKKLNSPLGRNLTPDCKTQDAAERHATLFLLAVIMQIYAMLTRITLTQRDIVRTNNELPNTTHTTLI